MRRILIAAISTCLVLVGLLGVLLGQVWIWFARPRVPADQHAHLFADAAGVTIGGLALVLLGVKWFLSTIRAKGMK